MAQETTLRKVKVEGGNLKFSAAHFITYGGKCERLHGHNYGVLVEMEGPHLEFGELANEWEILFGEKRYVFPRADVVELPIDNSTAERLAEYICGELRTALSAYDISNVQSITVGVEEAPTQMAYYRVFVR